MDDYMDKQTAANLLDNLVGMVEDTQENDYDTAIKMGIEALKAHIQPVTPMHWTPINPFNGGWSDVWRCSACGSQVSLGYCTNIMEYDFCPYCGAKDGEQNGTA